MKVRLPGREDAGIASDHRIRQQAFLRGVNERIAEAAWELGGDEPVTFLCECGRPGCDVNLALTLVEFASACERGPVVADVHARTPGGPRGME